VTAALLRNALAVPFAHFSPFLVLGDPSAAATLALARAAAANGATMLELGLPFSDPCADGPSIQAACARALAGGMTVGSGLRLLAEIAAAVPLPLNLLVYGNLVHARGFAAFCRDAAAAGASSLLVPDFPYEEGGTLRAACAAAGLAHVALVGPSTVTARLQQIAEGCDGFVYLAGQQGITGTGGGQRLDRRALVRATVAAVRTPVAVGFGLAARDDVAEVHAAGARIAVVGSALADTIAGALADGLDPVPAFAAACRAFAVQIPFHPDQEPLPCS
jgi:tryptophan synthase alpha chain